MDTEKTAAWVRQMQAGDESAFDALFAAYQRQAVCTAALITGDASVAEDAAQEAFVNCFLHIRELRDAERFRPWFFRILTRCAWKAAKQKRGILSIQQEEGLGEMLLPIVDSYPSERNAVYEKLYHALEGLGQKQRTAVVLYYFNDFSIREIAQATDALEATVKTRLFAAKRRLKTVLEQETGGEDV